MNQGIGEGEVQGFGRKQETVVTRAPELPADRIETIIDYDAVQRHDVHGDGMSTLEDPRPVIARLAELLASGELELPIKARFPLEQVSDAYREVEIRHGLGKIVLEVSTP